MNLPGSELSEEQLRVLHNLPETLGHGGNDQKVVQQVVDLGYAEHKLGGTVLTTKGRQTRLRTKSPWGGPLD